LGCPEEAELSLLLTDDAGIARLNRDYLGREGPTNVIAFPMREGEMADPEDPLLGDVAISVETAAREAREAGLAFSERFWRLLVHGLLHLLGYDHERPEDCRLMEEKEEEMMALIAKEEASDGPPGR